MTAAPTGWLDPETIQFYWADAPASPLLDDLLESARLALIKLRKDVGAPIPDPDADPPIPVPANLRIAQAMQARSSWESQRSNPTDDTLGGEQNVRLYPMSAAIRRQALADVSFGVVTA